MVAATILFVVALGSVLAVLYFAGWFTRKTHGKYDLKFQLSIYGLLSIRFSARQRHSR